MGGRHGYVDGRHGYVDGLLALLEVAIAGAAVAHAAVDEVAHHRVRVRGFAGARFVRDNTSELDLPTSSAAPLGVLKAAGAVGLVAGLAGLRPLGIAAAAGLVLFFLGAVAFHVRARVFHNIAFPGVFLALAAATLALTAASS